MSADHSFPQQIRPMLAMPAEPFDSAAHLFEIKWDGLRCLAFLAENTHLQSRNLREITFQYPELSDLHRIIRADRAILDGEIIVFNEGSGTPNFFKLQSRMHAKTSGSIKAGRRENPVIYVVFDLLFLQEENLLQVPFWKRREYLEGIYAPSPHLILSECFPEQGRSFFAQVKKLGLEGIVAKERNGLYFPGKRSPVWKKSRVTRSAHFIICGYTKNPRGRADLSALVIGLQGRKGEGFWPYGLVGAGLSQGEIDYLLGLLKIRTTEKHPFTHPPEPSIQNAVWVRPELVCEVEYLEVTPDRRLRHPLYRGLRPEISPEECSYHTLPCSNINGGAHRDAGHPDPDLDK